MAINLNVKTDYTFLSSTFTPEALIKKAILYKNNAVSICDFQNMFGTFQFYNLCIQHNLKPIIGVEFTLEYEQMYFSIHLFAINQLGYYNLVSLTSLVNENENQQYLRLNDLLNHNVGIFGVLSTHNSHLNKLYLDDNIAKINDFLSDLKNHLSNLFLGVYRYKNSNVDYDFLKGLCANYQINAIAFQHVTHQNKDDTLILNLLDCIKKQEKANRKFLSDSSIVEAYFKSDDELKISYDQDELNNLNNLIDSINIIIPKLSLKLPKIVENDEQFLYDYCLKQLDIFGINEKKYLERMQYEYDIICKMGFARYFLIVADYVKYAKDNNIVVGPARGSAGGSLIAYLLNITTIDPLKHNLFFERFLNPKRVTMPDIDIDFLDIRRDEVIEYVKNKYGSKNIAQIATFSTLGAKSSIRDMARVLSISNEEVDYLLKFYPQHSDISLKEAYKKEEKFKKIVDMRPHLKQLVALASNIEGFKRQSGIHAAGILMHADSLNNLVPTMMLPNKTLLCQYDYKDSEKLGLLKMDFLGLKNLNIIDSCINLVNTKYKLNLSIDNINYDSHEVYEFLSRGLCIGIFQLESDGMVRTIKKMKPTCFEDIVNLLAIYRPGPMKNIDSFIRRMHNEEKITYLHPILEEILAPTYGIIVYQEQIMQIVQKMALFDLAQADLFRRAITKKDAMILEKQKKSFIDGCIKNNIDNIIAEKVYSLIYSFAEYGFNKAHSVGYAKLALIMAYLKCHYPEIFYTILLNINMDGSEKKNLLFNESKKLNIYPVLPNLNTSSISYSYINNSIQFGLNQISFIKGKVAQEIINERNNGKFNSIYDVFIRLVKLDFSMNVFKALILSGSLDTFDISRDILLYNLPALYEYGKMFTDLPYKANDYLSYDYIPLPLLRNPSEKIDYISLEKDYLGIYVSTHPIIKIKQEKNLSLDLLKDIKSKYESNVLVKIINIEYRNSKTNKPYVSLYIEDESDNITLYVTNNLIDLIKKSFKKNDYIIINLIFKNDHIYVNNIQKIEGVIA